MVKPAQGGSGWGAAVVRGRRRVAGRDGGLFRVRPDGTRRAVRGRVDIAVSIVDLGEGPVALPAVEIVPQNGCTTTPPGTRRGSPRGTRRPGWTRIRRRGWRRPRSRRIRRWGFGTCPVDLIVGPDGSAHVLEAKCRRDDRDFAAADAVTAAGWTSASCCRRWCSRGRARLTPSSRYDDGPLHPDGPFVSRETKDAGYDAATAFASMVDPRSQSCRPRCRRPESRPAPGRSG